MLKKHLFNWSSTFKIRYLANNSRQDVVIQCTQGVENELRGPRVWSMIATAQTGLMVLLENNNMAGLLSYIFREQNARV